MADYLFAERYSLGGGGGGGERSFFSSLVLDVIDGYSEASLIARVR